jgi:ribosomal protein RSM22 (predicted rRNA methylase)
MATARHVSSLEDGWQDVLDRVLAKRSLPRMHETAKLGAKVAELSRAYNTGRAGDARDRVRLPIEARIAFSFPRDVPKAAAAVRELVTAGALRAPGGRPLRIVDLGAGLGAMTWGIVRALAASGEALSVEALLVDEDAEALSVAEAIAREARARFPQIALEVRTRTARLAPDLRLPTADVVVLGQVLSEVDTQLEEEARVERHAGLVAALLRDVVAPDGSLVVVEPALRDRTRHLHAVRDRLAASGEITIFAPCLHARACPVRALEGEWCHEDLAIDLPQWLVPVARAAGLRWQGLTFSYLVLRRDGASLASTALATAALPGSEPAPGAEPSAVADGRRVRLRIISSLLRSKGKTELWGCTDQGTRVRLRRLDRDQAESNAAWDELDRGDVVSLSDVDERGRVCREVAIDVWRTRH